MRIADLWFRSPRRRRYDPYEPEDPLSLIGKYPVHGYKVKGLNDKIRLTLNEEPRTANLNKVSVISVQVSGLEKWFQGYSISDFGFLLTFPPSQPLTFFPLLSVLCPLKSVLCHLPSVFCRFTPQSAIPNPQSKVCHLFLSTCALAAATT